MLDNGAVVIAKQSPATPAVTVHASFAAGSIYDPPGRSGLAHFVSKVIDRGTTTRTGDEIAEELENRGVSLTVSVNRHALQLVLTCLVEDLETVLAILADIVMDPTFPEADVETKRGEIITLIRQDEDNPAAVAGEAMLTAVVRRHASLRMAAARLGGERGGDNASRAAGLPRSGVLRHPRCRWSWSATSTRGVRSMWRAAPSAAGARRRAATAWTCPNPCRYRHAWSESFPMMNKSQADISYGFTAIAASDPAYYAYWLMNNILGQYSLGGRLGDSIRERQGMAYYVFSALDANVIPGPLTIRAGVSRGERRAGDRLDRRGAVDAGDGRPDGSRAERVASST